MCRSKVLLLTTEFSRGKKIFRPYQTTSPEDGAASAADEDTPSRDGDADQRRLRHQAGPAAQRPLTRSTIKPRLLFPNAEQRAERERGPDDVDEEAVTDIEMDNTHTNTHTASSLVSPPPTQQTKKGNGRTIKMTVEFTPASEASKAEATPEPVEKGVVGDPMSLATDSSFSSASASKGKGRSPFDSWQRTKSGRKRAGEANEEGSGKRTRSAVGSLEEGAVL